MRGIFSFVLILAFLGVLLSLLSLYSNSSRAIGYSEQNILSLERRHNIELELKDAVKSVLSNPEGENREEMSRNTAEKLAILESFWEKKMREEGIDADMWAGTADAYELERMQDEMSFSKRAIKCASCFDLSEKSLGWKKEIVPRAMAFLDVKEISGRELEVSRRGLSFVPDVQSAFSSLQGNVAFGASLYFQEENSSMMIIMPEGFS